MVRRLGAAWLIERDLEAARAEAVELALDWDMPDGFKGLYEAIEALSDPDFQDGPDRDRRCAVNGLAVLLEALVDRVLRRVMEALRRALRRIEELLDE